jgi:hypothetical protein
MTNDKCISYCRGASYTLAGTEDGFQCFCGNVLFDSMLLDNSQCNMTCDGGGGICGGPWALSVFSPDGRVSQAAGLEQQFSLPQPAAGMPDVSVHPGGILNTVLPVTTPLLMFPRQAPAASSSMSSNTAPGYSLPPGYVLPPLYSNQDIVSQIQALVNAALSEAHAIAGADIATLNGAVTGVQSMVDRDLKNMDRETDGAVSD